MAPPSGTVTFLFTDIVGSTRRWEEEPDAMRVELERHDALLRSAIESSGGHVVKGTGDGTLAAFGDADAALHAAAQAQRAIEVQNWMSQRPQLEGALAYAIEIFTIVGAYEPAAVLVGAARSGALTHVRTMTVPPERQQRSASPIREALGDSFDEHAALGAAMSFDELVAWTLATLDGLTGPEGVDDRN